MTAYGPDAVVVEEGAGRALLDGPLSAVLLAGQERTGGTAAFVLHGLAPRALGSPVHTHSREDEWSFVLEGQIGVQVGDQVQTAGPGALVLKPRGVPHAFWNAGDAPARLLEVITPGGFERYFEQLGEVLGASSGPPDLQRLTAVAAEHGLELDLASVPLLAQSHGLRLG
jgi:quercetin dioxygenase-like cupin family protein